MQEVRKNVFLETLISLVSALFMAFHSGETQLHVGHTLYDSITQAKAEILW